MTNGIPKRYTSVAIGLHWLIAFLIVGQIAGGWYMHNIAEGSTKFELYQWHKSFGITILFLSFMRLFWRVKNSPPPLPQGMAVYEKAGARISHVGFYILMIGIPIIGWLMVSSSPKEIPTILFKAIPWPHVPGIPKSESVEEFFEQTHMIVAYSTLLLLALHVGAALKHHFVNKDDVLARMLPFLRKG